MELKLVHKIYKDSDMSVSTLNTLIKELDGKNNEMIDTVKHIKKGYERKKFPYNDNHFYDFFRWRDDSNILKLK